MAGFQVGIDVGGTFTDFFLVRDGAEPIIHKTLSTPVDPSLAVMRGLGELGDRLEPAMPARDFIGAIDTIVHGTTVTTNATLTRRGARTGLITTKGLRDALEMRRGVREERYNNRYTNVLPLVPRYLRAGVGGRCDRHGRELESLSVEDVRRAVDLFRNEGVEAVAICFMNAFANPDHEEQAAAVVRQELPGAYLSVSTEILPSIRFYDRVSTTALNAYVGPILDRYLEQLQRGLGEVGFRGILLIMQSNGGVMAPEVARARPAFTLLSGPAGGPGAGLSYARKHDLNECIVVDMGGTSFEASLVVDGPVMDNDGEIDRLRCALPMLSIHTIGAGGGSIGWIDEGGLLRMGPQSAGADPGPACYGNGGAEPTTTDANLVLGYLDPDFFAGGRMQLDVEAARRAIETRIAAPLGLDVEAAAAGMYRIACTNMAQGVREITIKRGSDPREFPMIVAGGAGPLHSCLICSELEIPLQIVPREASVLCAVGMIMGDLKHDFVRTHVARLSALDWPALEALVADLKAAGQTLLTAEEVAPERQRHILQFDCRYLKQYHEVTFAVADAWFSAHDTAAITRAFHAEHKRLYGYSLEEEGTSVEIINVRLQSIGDKPKPEPVGSDFAGAAGAAALKGRRRAYCFEDGGFRDMPVYDGHRLCYGNRIEGPALVEMATTSVLISAAHDGVTDRYGSLVVYRKDRPDLVRRCLEGTMA